MKQLFVPTALTVANGIAELTAGQMCVVAEGTTTALTVAQLQELPPATPVQLAWKDVDGNLQTSMSFSANDVVNYMLLEPGAGTVQEIRVTPTLPASQAKGDEYILKVVDVTSGQRGNPMKTKTYCVYHTGTNFTVDTLIDAFVAKIGTDADMKIVVTDGTTYLIIKGTTPEETFRVACDGNLQFSTITYQTANIPAAGTTVKMQALESECESYGLGVTNKLQYPVKRLNSSVAAGDGYHTLVLDIAPIKPSKAGMNAMKQDRFKIYVAEKTNQAGTAAYELNAWLGIAKAMSAVWNHTHA